MIRIERHDIGHRNRFVLYENDDSAGDITFTSSENDKLIIEHTEVKPEYGGKGYGKKLVFAVVELARDKNMKIVPHCSYAKKVITSDENLNDILA